MKKSKKEDSSPIKTELSSKLITKIKFNLKTEVPEISYQSEDTGSSKEIKVKGKKKALDEFLSAMQELKPFFCDICEVKYNINNTKLSGVSFKNKGFVLTGQICLTENNIKNPLIINSPHILYENKNGFEAPQDVIKMLDNLKSKAVDYTNGETKDKQVVIDFNSCTGKKGGI